MLMARVHFGMAYGIDDIVGKFTGHEDLAVTALEAQIFVGRDDHRPVAAVAGHHNRLAERQILVAADFLAELS